MATRQDGNLQTGWRPPDRTATTRQATRQDCSHQNAWAQTQAAHFQLCNLRYVTQSLGVLTCVTETHMDFKVLP